MVYDDKVKGGGWWSWNFILERVEKLAHVFCFIWSQERNGFYIYVWNKVKGWCKEKKVLLRIMTIR